MVAYYLLIALIGIPGNTFILVFFFKTSKKHKGSSYRYFIIQLAIADLLCCTLVPVLKTQQLLLKSWIMEDFMCSVFVPITWMTVAVSSWILCALCYDRYTAIARPLAVRLSRRKITALCICIWILSITFYSPYAFFNKMEGRYCSRMYPESVLYLTRYFDLGKDVIKGYGPIFTSLTLLYNTKASLKAHGKEVARVQQTKLDFAQRKLSKIYKFVSMTTSVFVVCLLPCTVLNGVKNLAHNNPIVIQMDIAQLEILDKILGWAWALSYVNCAVNCFIYAGRFPEFRRYIKTCFKPYQKKLLHIQ